MKTLPLLLILSLVATQLWAQDPTEQKKVRDFGYYNRTDASIAFGIGKFKTDVVDGIRKSLRNDEMILSFQTVNGITYKGRVGLGVGIGIEKWSNGLFYPVFGQFYYDFKPKDNTFFGSVNLGTAIGTRDSTTLVHKGTGGFMAQIGVGYKMKVWKRLRFYYEIFYRYTAIESSYTNFVTSDSTNAIIYQSNIDYKVPLHFAGFKIGISFY